MDWLGQFSNKDMETDKHLYRRRTLGTRTQTRTQTDTQAATGQRND